jgi:replicative DNA helicase
MKGSPLEVGFHRTEEELKRNRLRQLVALGEKYYDRMYESGRGANRCYSNAKDAFYDAIGLASELGMKEEADALSKRLDHIKAVFRSQFT